MGHSTTRGSESYKRSEKQNAISNATQGRRGTEKRVTETQNVDQRLRERRIPTEADEDTPTGREV